MLKAIILNAGHGLSPTGQTDSGAQGITSERNEVVQIVTELYQALEAAARVTTGLRIFTVNSGITELDDAERLKLEDQVAKVNAILSDNGLTAAEAIVVSVHCNAGGASGIEAWYKTNDASSKKIAQKIKDGVVKATGLPDRGVHDDMSNRLGRLAIVRDVKCTSCLIECGFVDNKTDAALLMDSIKDDSFWRGIMQGISDFSGIKFDQMSLTFPDVPASHFAADAIRRNVDAGLIAGYADGTFKPDKPLTRGEAAVLIDRLYRTLRK